MCSKNNMQNKRKDNKIKKIFLNKEKLKIQ